MKEKIITIIYAIKTVLVLIAGWLQIFKATTILSAPEEMEQLTLTDYAFFFLMIIVIPCIIIDVLFYFICKFNEKKKKLLYFILIMIPSIICIINAVSFLIPFIYSYKEMFENM